MNITATNGGRQPAIAFDFVMDSPAIAHEQLNSHILCIFKMGFKSMHSRASEWLYRYSGGALLPRRE